MSRRRGREAQQDVSRRRHPSPTFSIRRLIHTSDEAAAKFCCCFCVPVCPARPCKSFETDSAIPCLCRQEEKEERERERLCFACAVYISSFSAAVVHPISFAVVVERSKTGAQQTTCLFFLFFPFRSFGRCVGWSFSLRKSLGVFFFFFFLAT